MAYLHTPRYPWRFQTQINLTPNYDVIGTVTRSLYTYDSGTSSWVLTSTDPPENIEFDFYPIISEGGFSSSGGKDTDSDAVKAKIRFTSGYTGTYSSLLPIFDATDILRLPWQETWGSETTYFSDTFNTFIADKNAVDGGGHSGTCSVSLDFTNQP